MTTSRVLVPKDGVVAVNLINELGVTLNPNGLTIRRGFETPTRETWETIGRALWTVGEAWQWWLGDWINWGEDKLPVDINEDGSPVEQEDGDLAQHAGNPTTADRYDAAHRITGAETQTLLNISSVCRRVARSRRRTPPLGFWIHQAVAPLEPDEQTEWLEEAIQSSMTVGQLRQAIKDAKRGNADNGDDGGYIEPSREYLTPEQVLHNAAVLVTTRWQPTGDGSYIVPEDAAAQLLVALGREPD